MRTRSASTHGLPETGCRIAMLRLSSSSRVLREGKSCDGAPERDQSGQRLHATRITALRRSSTHMVRSPRLLTWGSRRLPCKLDIDVTERNTSCKTDSDELPHSNFRLVLDIISSMKHNMLFRHCFTLFDKRARLCSLALVLTQITICDTVKDNSDDIKTHS